MIKKNQLFFHSNKSESSQQTNKENFSFFRVFLLLTNQNILFIYDQTSLKSVLIQAIYEYLYKLQKSL